MHYVRGNRQDFDRWESLGNYEWGYNHVLPYFKKSENILIDRLKTSQYHGTDGPVDVTEGPSTILGKVFVEALHLLGHSFVDDYNGHQQEGFAKINFSAKLMTQLKHFLKDLVKCSLPSAVENEKALLPPISGQLWVELICILSPELKLQK